MRYTSTEEADITQERTASVAEDIDRERVTFMQVMRSSQRGAGPGTAVRRTSRAGHAVLRSNGAVQRYRRAVQRCRRAIPQRGRAGWITGREAGVEPPVQGLCFAHRSLQGPCGSTL